MTGGGVETDDVVVIGGIRAWRVLVGALVEVALCVVLARADVFWLPVLSTTVFTGSTFVTRWFSRVLITPDALVVRERRTEKRYPWQDILELSWEVTGWETSGPVARVRGTIWDTPGPGFAAPLGRVLLSRRGRSRAEAALASAAALHAIPYTPGLQRVISKGRPPRLTSDGAR